MSVVVTMCFMGTLLQTRTGIRRLPAFYSAHFRDRSSAFSHPATKTLRVFGFIAGASDDPRAFVNFAFTLALFQNASVTTVGGKKVAIARADALAEPGAADRFADALRRSMSATADVIALDHFSYADLPLDEARSRFGIAPKAVPGPGWRD